MDTPTNESVRLELYVRTLSPPGARSRQEAVIDRLHRLAEEGLVADTNVHVWGRQIDPTTSAADTEQGQFILNRIAEFQQWALANNTTLETFYETREQSSAVTDEEYTTLVLPKLGLAEYHGEELAQVTPCTEPDGVYSVPDHLDDIERREQSRAGGDRSQVPPLAED